MTALGATAFAAVVWASVGAVLLVFGYEVYAVVSELGDGRGS